MKVLDSIGNRSCKRIMHEKQPLHKIMCVLIRCMIKGFSWRLLLFDWEINSFSKTNVTSEGAVSHNVLYYQQLSIARYEVCFDANNYLELQPLRWVVSFTMVICIVSSHLDWFAVKINLSCLWNCSQGSFRVDNIQGAFTMTFTTPYWASYTKAESEFAAMAMATAVAKGVA